MSNPIPTNNCDIFTVFPLGVSCTTTGANDSGYGGTMTLFITGGTPPYTINWSTGDVGVTTLTNLASGTYTATVIDNYGDYSGSTTCIVNAVTPTPTSSPTPTPTPSPAPSYPSELCLTKYQAPNTQYAFGYKGIVNGKPSWTGSTYDVVYNNTNIPPRWEISGYTPSNIVLQSNISIPQGLWTELGTSNTWIMTTGTCEATALNASVSKTMETCAGSSDGTVTVTAWAGVPPYSYSLDSITYQSSPTFTGLPAGGGSIYIKDTTGLILIRGYNILAGPAPTTYNLVLNTSTSTLTSSSKSVQWALSVSPALPVGVSITADILITNNFTNNYNSQQQILLTRGYYANAAGNAVINTNGNEVITSQANTRLCNGSTGSTFGTIYSGISKTYSVTLSGGTISGIDTFGVQNNNPQTNDCPAFGQDIHRIQIIHPLLSTSNCGNVGLPPWVQGTVSVGP